MFKIAQIFVFTFLFFQTSQAADTAATLLEEIVEKKAQTTTMAVIPAAGRGTRFGEEGIIKPKGFIEVVGQPIIYQSLANLANNGIANVLFVTGHCNKYYEELAQNLKSPTIKTAHNVDFAKFGNMHTVYTAKGFVTDSILLLDSDIIYPEQVLKALINDPHPNVLLATTTTKSGDEVYVEVDSDRNLVNLSKNPSGMTIDSESVGICKLSVKCFEAMCANYEAALKTDPNLKMEYEQGLIAVCKENPVHVLRLRFEDQCPWTEIDTQEHYKRAIDYVIPLMKQLNK